MMRTRPTPNADPERVHHNRILIGSDDPYSDVEKRLPDKLRKNGVLAIEVLMTTSPEWWNDASSDQQKDWVKSSIRWVKEHFGADNVAHLQLHLDESTPHITGFVVPIDPKTRRLNASRWTDGSYKLAQMQNSYADQVAHLGLNRGIARSKARHVDIQTDYGALTPASDVLSSLDVDTPPAAVSSSTRSEWANKQSVQLQSQLQKPIRSLENRAKTQARTERELDRANKKIRSLREQADRVRDISLKRVIDDLGLYKDPKDASKFIDDEKIFAISLKDGSKFYDHKAQTGGGGAIDLVKHVLQSDFKDAVAWLADRYGEQDASRALAHIQAQQAPKRVKRIAATQPAFKLPKCDETWSRVKAWLTQKRGLPSWLVDTLKQAGYIQSDTRANAVFPLFDRTGKAVGAELKGTGKRPFTGLAAGSSKKDGVFAFRTSSEKPLKTLVVAESALDALSYATLRQNELDAALVVSTAGARRELPSWVVSKLSSDPITEVRLAFDHDQQGQEYVEQYRRQLTESGVRQRITPDMPSTSGADWNDALRSNAISFSKEKGLSEPSGSGMEKRKRDGDKPRVR